MSIIYQPRGNRGRVEEVTRINMDECWAARTQEERSQIKSRIRKAVVKRRNKSERKEKQNQGGGRNDKWYPGIKISKKSSVVFAT